MKRRQLMSPAGPPDKPPMDPLAERQKNTPPPRVEAPLDPRRNSLVDPRNRMAWGREFTPAVDMGINSRMPHSGMKKGGLVKKKGSRK